MHNYTGPWSRRRVICAPCPQLKGDELCKAGFKSNHYHDKLAPGTGEWGGSCTCPDGQTYQVGDLWGNSANSTAKGECNALACYGGLAGECHRTAGPWSKKSVTCAPCPEGHLPTHPTSTTTAKAESSREGAGWSSVEELSNIFRDAVASNNLSEVGLIFHGFDKPTDSDWAPYKPCTTGWCADQTSVFWPASIINTHQRHTFAPTGLLLSPVHSRILCSWYADAGTVHDGCNSTNHLQKGFNGSNVHRMINRGRMFEEDQLDSMLNISMRDDPRTPGYTGCTPSLSRTTVICTSMHLSLLCNSRGIPPHCVADNEVLIDSPTFFKNLPSSIVAVVYGLESSAPPGWCPKGSCGMDEEKAVRTYADLLSAYNLTSSEVPLLKAQFTLNSTSTLTGPVFTNESARAVGAVRAARLAMAHKAVGSSERRGRWLGNRDP